MEVFGLHHYLICAPAELMEKCRAFYCDILGLKAGARPKTARTGYWLYTGDHPIVHLAIPKPGDAPIAGRPPRGYLDHVAFACRGLPATLDKLDRLQVPYRTSVVTDPPQVQVVVEDPAGTTIELNFRSESLPPGRM